MTPESVAEILSSPLAQELFASNIPAHIAYTGLDGAPRSVPISYIYADGVFEVFSPDPAPKIAALQLDPRIALSIDTTGIWPARTFLVRGTAHVDLGDTFPEVYTEANQRVIGPDAAAGFKAMLEPLPLTWASISITPTWAKLLDFETVFPSSLVTALANAQAAHAAAN